MRAFLIRWFGLRSLGFRILALLGLTSLVFWHLYIGFELYSMGRRELERFQKNLSTQISQYISDNETHLRLYDYERIRVNTIRMQFPYPVENLTIIGLYGEPIFERSAGYSTTDEIFRMGSDDGYFSFTRDLGFHYTFSHPFNDVRLSGAAIRGKLDLSELLTRITGQLFILYSLGIGFYVLQLFLIAFCVRRVTNPLTRFTNLLKRGGDITAIKPEDIRFAELSDFIRAYEGKTRTELNLREQLLKRENEANLGRMAAQVAHDIRSPLAALGFALEYLSGAPEDKRLLIRNAVNRINDIANDLVGKSKTHNQGKSIESEKAPLLGKQHIWSLVESIVLEKQIQIQNRGITISMLEGPDCYELFALLDGRELKRLVSNLINNSLEALPNQAGKIEISLGSAEAQTVLIIVRDNGKGIPVEALPKIMERGSSFGKPQGTGLGLYHAKTCAEKWGGDLKISSTVGKGTEVKLLLPQCEPPAWFDCKIEISSGWHLVILDDDPLIHSIWKQRLAALSQNPNQAIFSHHFMSSYQVREWVAQNPKLLDTTLFLIDFELNDETATGLDLIQEMSLQRKSFLITGRFDEVWIHQECEKLGVRLIPKILAEKLPITVTSSPKSRWQKIAIKKPLVTNNIFSILFLFLISSTAMGCTQSLFRESHMELTVQEKILQGLPYTDDEWNQYLNTVHSQTSGVTVPFSTFATDLGPNTYEVLLNKIPKTSKHIWDLGCGNAYLTNLVWEKFTGRRAKVGGSDLVVSEIEHAKKRLAHTDITLVAEPLQKMSNLSQSVDVALAHLVLMLVLPLEEARDEIHRILKPDGELLAVVTRPDSPDSLMNQGFDRMEGFIRKHYPNYKGIRSGDVRMQTESGIKELFSPEKGFKDLKFTDYSMLMEGTPEQIWERFFGTTHLYFVLPETLRSELRLEILQWMRSHTKENNQLKMDQPLRLFSVKRK